MQWYYSKGGSQLGPVAESELVSKLASGELLPSDLVWKEGMADWIPASQVPELKIPAQAAVSAGTVTPVQPAGSIAGPSPYSAPAAPLAPGQDIPNYLWQSIVVTVMCCPAFGIPSIVYAAKVDGLKAQGQFEAAAEASAAAKKWAMIALISWVVVVGLYLLFIAVMMMIGASAGAVSR